MKISISFYNSFIGLKQLPEQARSVVRNYSIIVLLFNFAFSLTATFSIIYIIDAVGFKDAATLSAITLFVVLLTDYPSGSIGDWIGQKYVILTALSLFSVAFYFMSLASNFQDFVFVSIMLGLGGAQASGALQSWLDNAYKEVDPSLDQERKNYGYSMSKIQALSSLVSGITFIIGGVLATVYSRETAFQIQSVVILLLAVLVFKLLSKPKSEIRVALVAENNNNRDKAENSFYTFLIGGFQFLFSSKKSFFFIMGWALTNVIWYIWGALLLFPFYFGYTGGDSSAGILRASIFFTGVIIQIKLSTYTKNVENDKLMYFILIQGIVLFGGGMILMQIIPLTNSLNFLGIGILYLIFFGVSITNVLIFTLFQRKMIDLVPSENRNAVYSLIPTIRSAIAIPLFPFVGSLIENSGMASAFGFLLSILLISTLFLWLSEISPETEIMTRQPLKGIQPIAME